MDAPLQHWHRHEGEHQPIALPQINAFYGEPVGSTFGPFYSAIYGGTLQPPTMTEIVISTPEGYRIVFKGSFDVAAGDVTGGTMTGFSVFAGSTKMMEGSGFAVGGAALFDSLQNLGTDSDPFFHLIFDTSLKLVGSKQDDYFFGGEIGNDVLLGRSGNDWLRGWEGDDVLRGGKGNDHLDGGEGVNTLHGGKDDDIFHFDLYDSPGKDLGLGNIKDFKVGEDLISLNFDGLVPAGFMAKSYFHKGTEATTADQVVIYDKQSGKLYVDYDGTGTEAQVQFAKVTAGTKLNADDFFVGYGMSTG